MGDGFNAGAGSGPDGGDRVAEYRTRRRYDWADGPAPSTAVVETIADSLDRNVADLPFLHDYADPDALDTVVARGSDDVVVTFEYADMEVAVYASGELFVGDDR